MSYDGLPVYDQRTLAHLRARSHNAALFLSDSLEWGRGRPKAVGPGDHVRQKPRAMDLFCGAGGLTEGLRRADFNIIGAVEIDPLAAEMFRANHPKVHLWELDIRQLTAPQILRSLHLNRGELDLLAGCPPCQGFSAMRRLNGGRRVRDDLNALLFDFLRLVKGLRPKAVSEPDRGARCGEAGNSG